MQEELCFCRQGSTTIVLCETIIFHEFESNPPICSGSPNGRRENGRECFGHNEDCQGGEGSHYSGQDLEWSFRDLQRIFFFKHIFSSPFSQIYITRGSFHFLLCKHLSSPCSQVEETLQEKPTEVDQSQLLVLLSIIIIVYNYQLTRASSYFIINYHYCS